MIQILLFLLSTTLLSGCQPVMQRGDSLRYPALRPPSPAIPQVPFSLSGRLKREMPLIVIDAGHGGEDRGTISLVKPCYQEKQLTLITAQLLQGYLEYLGYPTKMTRSDDTFIAVLERAAIANQIKPSIFVSVHYNSAPNQEAHGIEIFYHKTEKEMERSQASKELASVILNHVLNSTQAKSRGVKNGNFAVIRETKMPAVLIEGGFLTNTAEMERIKNPLYLKQLAWGIAQGIEYYFELKKPIRPIH